jgi:N-dimethylarginine dimethylaminohydrolase
VTVAECSTPPAALIVHDPVAAGAFDAFDSLEEGGDVERDLLFRARPERARYAEQHRAFVDTLRAHVSDVLYLRDLVDDEATLAPARRNPNQVFTRDSLITLPWAPEGYIAARMRNPIRRPETHAMEAAMRRLGLREIVRLPDDLIWEGGDAVPFSRDGRRTLLVGFGGRTPERTLDFLQEALIPRHADEIVAVQLPPSRLNLDGSLLPAAADVVVTAPESILGGVHLDAHARHEIDVLGWLRDQGVQIVEATQEESMYAQACNFACLGDRRIVAYDLCDRVVDLLARHDVEVHKVAGSELVKGRGGPRCMTRPIYCDVDLPTG